MLNCDKVTLLDAISREGNKQLMFVIKHKRKCLVVLMIVSCCSFIIKGHVEINHATMQSTTIVTTFSS